MKFEQLLEKVSKTHAVSVHSVHPGWQVTIMEHGTCNRVVEAGSSSPLQALRAAVNALDTIITSCALCPEPKEAPRYKFCYKCWWAQDPRNPQKTA